MIRALGDSPGTPETMETDFMWWIHSMANPFWDGVFKISDLFGRKYFIALVVLGATGFHAWRRETHELWIWLILAVLALGSCLGLKAGIGRPRPELWPWMVSVSLHSFPSGHAVASATLFPMLARQWIRFHPGKSKIPHVLTAGMILYVGLGRVYLGVHWPTDVIAGWLLGGTTTWAALALGRRFTAPPNPLPPPLH